MSFTFQPGYKGKGKEEEFKEDQLQDLLFCVASKWNAKLLIKYSQ